MGIRQTYDLEDAVAVAEKPAARFGVRHVLSQPRALGIREQAVRINSVDTRFALDDLTEVVRVLPTIPHYACMGCHR